MISELVKNICTQIAHDHYHMVSYSQLVFNLDYNTDPRWVVNIEANDSWLYTSFGTPHVSLEYMRNSIYLTKKEQKALRDTILKSQKTKRFTDKQEMYKMKKEGDVRELTVAEIERRLGHTVKIVKE